MVDRAQQYDKLHVAHQAKDGVKLIDQLSPAKGSRVLDIGCGTGFLASVFAERVGPEGMVTGVDPDGERIHVVAQKNYILMLRIWSLLKEPVRTFQQVHMTSSFLITFSIGLKIRSRYFRKYFRV